MIRVVHVFTSKSFFYLYLIFIWQQNYQPIHHLWFLAIYAN